MIKNEQELQARIASCVANLDKKFTGADGKRAIVICGGTGCLSSDSMKIKEKFEELVKANNLEDKVTVNIVGCFGFCFQSFRVLG